MPRLTRSTSRKKARKERRGTSRSTHTRVAKALHSEALAFEVFQRFPHRDLSKLPKASNDAMSRDYMGNQKIVRIVRNYRVQGVLRMGWTNTTTNEKIATASSGKGLKRNLSPFLKAVRQSCTYEFPRKFMGECLDAMRVTCRLDDSTGCRTDPFGGTTPTCYLPYNNQCPLRIYKDVDFRCSVVRYKNQLFIPLSYDENSGLQLIGVHPDKPDSCRLFESADIGDDLKELTPVGMLDFVVLGIKEGKLQCCPLPEPGVPFERNLAAPKDLAFYPFSRALEAAELRPILGRTRSICMGKAAQEWSSFEAWRHRYKFIGTAVVCPRIFVSFRTLRLQCTSDNCNDPSPSQAVVEEEP